MENENLHAIIGQKQVDLENMHVEYGRLLALLGMVISGEVKPAEVVVDLEKRTWAYTPAEKTDDTVSVQEPQET